MLAIGNPTPERHAQGVQQDERGALKEAELRVPQAEIELEGLCHHREEEPLAEGEQLDPGEQERRGGGVEPLMS